MKLVPLLVPLLMRLPVPLLMPLPVPLLVPLLMFLNGEVCHLMQQQLLFTTTCGNQSTS